MFNVKESNYGGEFLFFENIKMNGNRSYSLPQPTGSKQPAIKKYVDDENTKQDIAINSKAEKSVVLLLDGTQAMTGNIDMSGNRIYSLPLPTGPQKNTQKNIFYEKQAMKPPIIMLIVKSLSISPHPLMIMTLSIKNMLIVKQQILI